MINQDDIKILVGFLWGDEQIFLKDGNGARGVASP